MKRRFGQWGVILFLVGRNGAFASGADADMARFAAAKEAQAREFAAELTNKAPEIAWSFFDAVRVDDWQTATNLAERLNRASGRFGTSKRGEVSEALQSPVWQTISETLGAYEQFHDWDAKWLRRFGKEIIDSIPRGSIYFGGTDPGRFLITALSESHREGKPFFTLTQNQLADATYLDYVRKIYGQQLNVLSAAESQKAFQDYVDDARRRLQAGQLKSGEDVRVVEGRVQVSGQVAVMAVNGLIAKALIAKNPAREIFVEESFPLEWMYPQLVPHGLILKLERKPLARLTDEVVEQDQKYWAALVRECFGEVVAEQTTLRTASELAEKNFRRKDWKAFPGDVAFARNEDVRKCFSKLRSSIGGVYAWRAERAAEKDEQQRMQKAAETAFLQAFVIYPLAPEAVFRYCNLLGQNGRVSDAVQIASVALRLDPEDRSLQGLVRSLRSRE